MEQKVVRTMWLLGHAPCGWRAWYEDGEEPPRHDCHFFGIPLIIIEAVVHQ